MVLGAVYEGEFHEGSFGFRPGRSAHQALRATWQSLMGMGGGWVVEVDIRKFLTRSTTASSGKSCVNGCAMATSSA